MNDILKAALVEVLGLESAEIIAELSAVDVEAWDSIGHLNLIMRIEEAFDIRFETSEIPELNSTVAIQARLHAAGKI